MTPKIYNYLLIKIKVLRTVKLKGQSLHQDKKTDENVFIDIHLPMRQPHTYPYCPWSKSTLFHHHSPCQPPHHQTQQVLTPRPLCENHVKKNILTFKTLTALRCSRHFGCAKPLRFVRGCYVRSKARFKRGCEYQSWLLNVCAHFYDTPLTCDFGYLL